MKSGIIPARKVNHTSTNDDVHTLVYILWQNLEFARSRAPGLIYSTERSLVTTQQMNC